MEINTKEYKLNKDFRVDCITKVVDAVKVYGIKVIQVGLPFEPVVEEYQGITIACDANLLFKSCVQKYKNAL